jgi:hypothetical protein
MKKKKFIVLPRNGKIFEEGLITGRGHRKFKKPGAMWITDEAEAREIDHEYGMKGRKVVAVTTDQQYEWSANNEHGDGTKMNNIHNYTFGQMGVTLPARSSLVGTKKNIGGTMYIYVMDGEKLKLKPLPQKPRVRDREVTNGIRP